MIEIGYNGIEFGNYTEDEFLSMIPADLVEFCKLITHRDTQITGDEHWRLQGTISSIDFATYVLNNPEGLSNIASIKRDGANSLDFLITMIIPVI